MSFNSGGSSRISTSSDVGLNNPLDNQVLSYNATLQKWQNTTPVGALAANMASSRSVYPAPGSGAYQLVWTDTFQLPNGATTAAIDATKWCYQQGSGSAYYNAGWGNSELETYTTSQTNVQITSQGLELRLINQSTAGYDGTKSWSSGKIITKSKFAFVYGKVEADIKVPYGKGAWPAFWMLGDDNAQNTWPGCGEIDIMETGQGGDFATVHGTIHGPGYSGGNGVTNAYTSSSRLDGAFHTYGIEWLPSQINWYFDGTVYATVTLANVPQPADWVFDHPFYLLLNVAVANGGFPGPLDTSTFQTASFNGTVSAYATMVVSAVRVYQK